MHNHSADLLLPSAAAFPPSIKTATVPAEAQLRREGLKKLTRPTEVEQSIKSNEAAEACTVSTLGAAERHPKPPKANAAPGFLRWCFTKKTRRKSAFHCSQQTVVMQVLHKYMQEDAFFQHFVSLWKSLCRARGEEATPPTTTPHEPGAFEMEK